MIKFFYMHSHTLTHREEQDEESDEFLDLFENGLLYIEGGRTSSGFYTVEEAVSGCVEKVVSSVYIKN